MRVPTPAVSVVDIVFELKKNATKEKLMLCLRKLQKIEPKGILGFCDEPLVSIDFKEDERSSIIDALSTMVIEDNMVKIVSWYDNEWGYSNRAVDLMEYVIKKGL